MKKIITVCFFFSTFIHSYGNVIMPRAYVSEILADSLGNWTIEMGFYPDENLMVDSVRLVTSSGSSMIIYYEVLFPGGNDPFDSLALITSANLAIPVAINPQGDFVRLVSYVWGEEQIDEITFGNYPGSYLDCIQFGESVTCINWMDFAIDTSPSIGFGNSEGGGYSGNFSGVILDPSGNPITGGFVNIVGNAYLTLYPDEQGYFSNNVHSRRFTFDTIKHYNPPWPYNVDTYTCEPVDFCLRPDSSFSQDIICTSLVMGIDDKESSVENVVTVAPNPFSDKVTFYFNLKNYPSPRDLEFSIYTLDGKEIYQVYLQPDQKRIDWNPSGNISPGTLIYKLENKNSIVKTGKFVKL